jgi:hypothetical protein
MSELEQALEALRCYVRAGRDEPCGFVEGRREANIY